MPAHARRATIAATLTLLLATTTATAQNNGWRAPADNGDRYGSANAAPAPNGGAPAPAPVPTQPGPLPITPVNSAPQPTRARVSKGSGSLPAWMQSVLKPITSFLARRNPARV